MLGVMSYLIDWKLVNLVLAVELLLLLLLL